MSVPQHPTPLTGKARQCKGRGGAMRVLDQRCAGLDVHQGTVVACVLVTQPSGRVQRALRTFGTMTADLVALSAWLREAQVEQVAMESTGVYWWPVYNILEEGGHRPLVVNPQHTKALPGRKTDVRDSEWLADLLRHGLVRGSFIPPAAIRHLRALTRYRATLVQQRAQEVTRLQKVLESANIKLAVVATDILGVNGRSMLRALAAGEDDPAALADLARGKLIKKLEALRQALEGRVQPHHRLLIRATLQHTSYLAQAISALDEAVCLLRTSPAIGAAAAAAIVAEIGSARSQFRSAKHLAAWAGLCPGTRQSGGKRLSGKITHGAVWLRGILGEVAWAAIRKKGTPFGAR
jgi:transposase